MNHPIIEQLRKLAAHDLYEWYRLSESDFDTFLDKFRLFIINHRKEFEQFLQQEPISDSGVHALVYEIISSYEYFPELILQETDRILEMYTDTDGAFSHISQLGKICTVSIYDEDKSVYMQFIDRIIAAIATEKHEMRLLELLELFRVQYIYPDTIEERIYTRSNWVKTLEKVSDNGSFRVREAMLNLNKDRKLNLSLKPLTFGDKLKRELTILKVFFRDLFTP